MLILITSTAIFLTIFYYYWTKNYNHWENKSVPCMDRSFPFGSIKRLLLMQTNLINFLNEAYTKYPSAKAVGFYALRQPMLIVKDLDLIKDVLVKDFNVFADNGFVTYESVDAMIGLNPFALRGAAWKSNRAVQSPAHRISKIKLMVPLMVKTAQNFVKYVSQQTEEICVNVVSRFYTIDTVASCAYGVNNDSFFDKNSQFLKNTLGQLFNDTNVGALSAFFAPWFSLIFRTRIIKKRAEDFFLYLADELLSQRKRSTIPGNDLVQHLLFLQEKSAKEGTPCKLLLFLRYPTLLYIFN